MKAADLMARAHYQLAREGAPHSSTGKRLVGANARRRNQARRAIMFKELNSVVESWMRYIASEQAQEVRRAYLQSQIRPGDVDWYSAMRYTTDRV